MSNIKMAINELHKGFDELNKMYFGVKPRDRFIFLYNFRSGKSMKSRIYF